MLEIRKKGAYVWPYYGGWSSVYMDGEKKYQVRKLDAQDYAICVSSVRSPWQPLEDVEHFTDPDSAADKLRGMMAERNIPRHMEPWPYGGNEIARMMEETAEREDANGTEDKA